MYENFVGKSEERRSFRKPRGLRDATSETDSKEINCDITE